MSFEEKKDDTVTGAGTEPTTSAGDNRNLPVTTEQPDKGEGDSLTDAWWEVGEQLQQLGGKLAGALKASWQDDDEKEKEEREESMRKIRDNLRSASDQVDRSIRSAREETAVERASTMKATRKASKQSLDEVRLMTASTLRKLNEQLDKLASRLDRDKDDDQNEGDETSSTTSTVTTGTGDSTETVSPDDDEKKGNLSTPS